MNVGNLVPAPQFSELFARRSYKFVPDAEGCYTLTTFDGTVLYVGLAKNLRRRFFQHLEDPEKDF